MRRVDREEQGTSDVMLCRGQPFHSSDLIIPMQRGVLLVDPPKLRARALLCAPGLALLSSVHRQSHSVDYK